MESKELKDIADWILNFELYYKHDSNTKDIYAEFKKKYMEN